MPGLMTCRYCQDDTVNARYHENCRGTFCEDLLSEIHLHLTTNQNEPLPPELVDKILKGGPFETKSDFIERQRRKEELGYKRAQWKANQEEFLERAKEEWERTNPSPGEI